jgi:hypothetical protein
MLTNAGHRPVTDLPRRRSARGCAVGVDAISDRPAGSGPRLGLVAGSLAAGGFRPLTAGVARGPSHASCLAGYSSWRTWTRGVEH